MKQYLRNLSLLAGGMDQNHLRMILVLISLILFVLGAGAPEASSPPGSG